MRRSSNLPIREAHRLLARAGFIEVPSKRHPKWRHPDGRVLTLPGRCKELYGELASKVLLYGHGKLTRYERSG